MENKPHPNRPMVREPSVSHTHRIADQGAPCRIGKNVIDSGLFCSVFCYSDKCVFNCFSGCVGEGIQNINPLPSAHRFSNTWVWQKMLLKITQYKQRRRRKGSNKQKHIFHDGSSLGAMRAWISTGQVAIDYVKPAFAVWNVNGLNEGIQIGRSWNRDLHGAYFGSRKGGNPSIWLA